MAIFNSYVKLPEGKPCKNPCAMCNWPFQSGTPVLSVLDLTRSWYHMIPWDLALGQLGWTRVLAWKQHSPFTWHQLWSNRGPHCALHFSQGSSLAAHHARPRQRLHVFPKSQGPRLQAKKEGRLEPANYSRWCGSRLQVDFKKQQVIPRNIHFGGLRLKDGSFSKISSLALLSASCSAAQ